MSFTTLDCKLGLLQSTHYLSNNFLRLQVKTASMATQAPMVILVKRESGVTKEIVEILVFLVLTKPMVHRVRRVNQVYGEAKVHKVLPVHPDLKVMQEHGDRRVIVANLETLARVEKMVKMAKMVILVIMVAEGLVVQVDHLDLKVSRDNLVLMVPMATLDPEVREPKLLAAVKNV